MQPYSGAMRRQFTSRDHGRCKCTSPFQQSRSMEIRLKAERRTTQDTTPVMTVFVSGFSCSASVSQDHGYATRDIAKHSNHSQDHARSCLVHVVTAKKQRRSCSVRDLRPCRQGEVQTFSPSKERSPNLPAQPTKGTELVWLTWTSCREFQHSGTWVRGSAVLCSVPHVPRTRLAPVSARCGAAAPMSQHQFNIR